jgi:hypothetical protein
MPAQLILLPDALGSGNSMGGMPAFFIAYHRTGSSLGGLPEPGSNPFRQTPPKHG